MRHAWLALVVASGALVGLAGTAYAMRAPSCKHLERPLVVTPSDPSDRTPPSSPAIDSADIVLDRVPGKRRPVETLMLHPSGAHADAVLWHITLEDRLGRVTLTTTPKVWFICSPGIELAPGTVKVEVIAQDAAGNRSAPTRLSTFVVAPSGYRCGLGPMILLFGRAIVGLVLVLAIIAMFGGTRLPKRDGDSVSPLVADHIAHAVQRRLASACVAMLAGALATAALYESQLALLVFVLTAFPFARFLAAQRVLRVLDHPEARAEVREHVLVVRSPDGQAHVTSSCPVIDRAKRHAVPTSIAR